MAAELIGSADRAARRGGVAAAAAFWERAVALTPDPGRRAARALIAAEAKYAAGDFAATGKLLAAADIGPLDEHGHSRVELMRARIAFQLNRGADAPSLLLHAAQRLQPLDALLARQTFLETLLAAIYVGRLADGCGLAEVARGAKSVPLDPSRCRIRTCSCAGLRYGRSTAMSPPRRSSKTRWANTLPSHGSWMCRATRTASWLRSYGTRRPGLRLPTVKYSSRAPAAP